MKKADSLDAAGRKYGTDKSSSAHDMLRYYERFINHNPKYILEIGVDRGASLRMWREYYDAVVYGIDCNPNCFFQLPGLEVRIGNQDDEAFLNKVCDEIEPDKFDLIIDDCSHLSSKTIRTYEILFKRLKSGGVYIVEDVSCSYWAEFRDQDMSQMEYFKTLADAVNWYGARPYWCGKYPAHVRGSWFLQAYLQEIKIEIDYVVFMNNAVIIQKK